MNNITIPNTNSFASVSRDIWQQVRDNGNEGKSKPTCGDFTRDFYGANSGETINFPALTQFIKDQLKDHTKWFDWSLYIPPTTKEPIELHHSSVIFQFDDTIDVRNTIPFEYTNKDGKKITANLSALLNKRVCYLEADQNLLWAFDISIDSKKEEIKAELNFFYQDTYQFRSYADNSVKTNTPYIAISLQAKDLDDYMALLGFIFNQFDSRLYSVVEKQICNKYAEKIISCEEAFELNFLYENAPDFVLSYLSQRINKETFFNHLLLLKVRDESKWFKDTSGAIINILKACEDPKFLYEKFKANPILLKQFFFNLDGQSSIEGQLMLNKLIFAGFMLQLCNYNSYRDFNKDKIPTFIIGGEYNVESYLHYNNDPVPTKYFLRQKRIVTKTFTFPKNAEGANGKISVKEEVDDGLVGNYEPFEPVYFVDNNAQDKTPILVPAIYVKALSHIQEVQDLQKALHIGADILAIVLGIASLGSASPLLIAIGALDLGLSTADLAITLNEDKLMQTEDGRAFLETWQKISLYGGIALAGPLLIRSAFTLGAKLINKATIAATKQFLKTSLLKILLEVNIAKFSKNTLRILEPIELFHSGEYIANANALWQTGAVFVEGEFVAGKQGFGLAYKGEIIATAVNKEKLMQQLGNILKLRGDKLVVELENLFNFKILLKNQRFADLYIKILKQKKLPLSKWLTVEEAAVIRYYTTSAYEELNKALRGLATFTEELQAFEALLNRALDKLPKKAFKQLFRSFHMSEEKIKANFIEGQTYTEKAFFSSSYNYESFLQNWLKQHPKHNVLMKIECRNGKLIEDISDIYEEAEVLFKSGTQFEIVSINKIAHPISNEIEIMTEILLKEK